MPAARPTLHTVKELSLATLWLLQHEQYYHVGYALLEYVTHVAIERLPPEERAAMYQHMEEKSAGLKSQVQTATLLNVLAAASASASSSSSSSSGAGGLFGSLLPLVFSSAPKAPDASLVSMVEEAMLHMMPAARPEDTTTLLRMVAHGKEGLLAYLNRSDRSAASTQKDAAAPSSASASAAAAGRV